MRTICAFVNIISCLMVAAVSCGTLTSFDELGGVATEESTEQVTTETVTEDFTSDYFDVTEDGTPAEWVTESLEEPKNELPYSARELNCTQCKCGNAEIQGKIVGGVVSRENAYSWMAALYYNNRFTCGGSLVSDRYILTAAHCAIRQDPARFRVQLLVHNRTKPTSNSVERSVKSIRTFFFNGLSNNNDIALLEMTFPVAISADRLVPICLPADTDAAYEGKMAVVTGWGKTAGGGLSATLQELKVPILANRACRRAGYWAIQITNKMICAGYVEGGRDSCQFALP
ncbi:oviductin [Culex quinquefasciatus]|uniref:Oviductin n=1 Tax=Culex quinquefasciatus TaxID=7176 RepID=B0WNI7_CULQU|nr:oviductin [Culex quinquefasciatus]|eukprot:XP_001850271.1 oviductin [Culex quinquefasciatus]